MAVAMLGYAYGCSPVDLWSAPVDLLDAMAEVLAAARARAR